MVNANIQAGGNTRTGAQDRSALISVYDISGVLERAFGRQLLSLIVGENVDAVQLWSTGDLEPSEENERRLRNAHKVYELLCTAEDDRTIRAWFMGMNSQLEDTSPAEALADDQVRNVMVSARAFVSAG